MSLLSLALWALSAVPFREPPAVTVEELGTSVDNLAEIFPQDVVFPFADDEGYVYTKHLRVGLGTTSDARCVPQDDPAAVAGSNSCQSVIACWHPKDPAKTRRHLYMVADVAPFQSAPFTGKVVWNEGLVAWSAQGRHRSFRCTRDGFTADQPVRVHTSEIVTTPQWIREPVVLNRRLCGVWNRTAFEGPTNLEFACMDAVSDFSVLPNGAPSFSGETLFTFAEIDAHLQISPLSANSDGTPILVRTDQGNLTEAREEWLLPDAQLSLPDGRFVFSLIRRSAVARAGDAGVYQDSEWHFVLPPNAMSIAALRTIRGPDWPLRKQWPTSVDPDTKLQRPYYDHANDLIVFEARGQEFANDRFTLDDVDDVPRGYFGAASYGFFVLDLDAVQPYLGYVSASDTGWSKAMDYFNRGNFSDGASLIAVGEALVWRYGAAPYTPTREYRLIFHPEQFDLDSDGLTAAEERALGTSDLDAHSDDDYVNDRAERDLGFDPTDPLDAPVPQASFGALQATTSALISRRFKGLLPEPWRQTGSASAMVRSHAPFGPLCALDAAAGPLSGRCWDSAGSLVASFPHPPVADRAMAYDGRHVITLSTDQDVLEAYDLHTNVTTIVGALSPPELDTGAFLRIFPVDGKTVFVQRARSVAPAIWVVRDGVQTQVFDLAAAELAAGQTTPSPAQVATMRLLPTHFEVLGFVPDASKNAAPDAVELLVAVQGQWRRYIIAITPEGSVREHSRYLNQGLGDLTLTAESAFGLWAGGYVVGDVQGFVALGGVRLHTGDSFDARPVPAFGTLLVENRDPRELEQPQQAGLHEIVTFGGALQPGETLVFVSNWTGFARHVPPGTRLPKPPAMLLRVHPRGGMVPAWGLDDQQQVDVSRLEYDFVDVSGMDLDQRYYLCLADRGADTLRIYRPQQSGGVPQTLVERIRVPGIRDCRWRSSGALSILVESEAESRIQSHTLTRPIDAPRHRASAFVVDPEDNADSQVRRAFVKGPGVDLELIPFGSSAFVAGPEAEFARVEYDLESGLFRSPWGEFTVSHLATQNHPSVVLRPDGRALVLPSIVDPRVPGVAEPLVIVDPSTPAEPTVYVTPSVRDFGDGGKGMVAAAVPWERFTDPWTGAPLDPSKPFAEVSPTFPLPVAPTQGVPVSTTNNNNGASCATTSPASSLWVVAFLGLTAFRRRRVTPS